METIEPTVAFIGLGAMGSRMAPRLADAGYPLVVWNRSHEKAAALEASGASVAGSPGEAAAAADVVITMLSDPAALTAVTGGPTGVVAGLRSGATVIEMSTVGPAAIAALAATMRAGQLLDAPVLGSLAEVEAGTLKVFAGGPAELVERWTPLLSALGTVIPVGPLGSGAAAKLVANATLVGLLGLLGEAVQLADTVGLSREVTYEVLAQTPLAAQADRRRAAIESRQFPLRFALPLARKDIGLAVDAAAEAGGDVRLATAAASWLRDAEAAGMGEQDFTALLGYIVERRSAK